MKKPRPPVLSTKKQPKQDRSKQLVKDILEAAVRVLREHGARGFTTWRVAEEAGCSVGSLYQYFPNKESLLFRMQADEWDETGVVLGGLLTNRAIPPLDRLRRVIAAFFRSELAERDFRGALHDSGALIRDAPESRAHRRAMTAKMTQFMADALPHVPTKRRAFIGEYVMTTMSVLGERITRDPITKAECDAWSAITADCLCAYLEKQ